MKLALCLLLAAAPLTGQQEEKPKVPKDSIMATITGCLKGRALKADDVRQADTTTGVNVSQRTFRISGKKDVMALVKEYDEHVVEITGLLKKSSLIEPGVKFKGGRVVVGGGGPTASAGGAPSPADNVPVIDALTVRQTGGSCGS